MGLIDDICNGDAAAFLDADGMPGNESITYTPRGGSAKTIIANVVRNPPTKIDGVETAAPWLEISIANDATRGVASVDTGGDRVTMKKQLGKAAVVLQVVEIVSQDGAMWRLRIG